MTHHLVRWVGAVVVSVVVAAGPVRTEAGPSSDNLLELAAKGGPAVGLSLGVSPLHFDATVPLEPVAGSTLGDNGLLGDRDRGRALSFDVKLRWPTGDLPFEPYLVLGPALLVDPHDVSGLTGVPADPVLRLGAKAGAGFNWRLGKDATLFGSYDVTTSGADRSAFPTTKGSAAGGSVGYDVLYGVRFGF